MNEKKHTNKLRRPFYFEGHLITSRVDPKTRMFYCDIDGRAPDRVQQGSEDNALWYARDLILHIPRQA